MHLHLQLLLHVYIIQVHKLFFLGIWAAYLQHFLCDDLLLNTHFYTDAFIKFVFIKPDVVDAYAQKVKYNITWKAKVFSHVLNKMHVNVIN